MLSALGIAPHAVGLVLLLSTLGHVSQVSLPPMRDSAASARQHYGARIPTSVKKTPLPAAWDPPAHFLL